MGWVKLDTRLPEHPAVSILSDREFRQLVTAACAYARGEALFGPELLEEHGLARYGFGSRTRQRWNRIRLWEKFEGQCHLCGKAVPFSAFHIEHVIPISRGGSDSWDNLNIAHPSCNLAKGSKLLEEIGSA